MNYWWPAAGDRHQKEFARELEALSELLDREFKQDN